MPASVKHLTELLADNQKAKQTALFAKWPSDRLFYPVNLIKLDHTNRKASVRFEDDTKFDFDLTDLHLQLNDADIYADVEDVICCACDGGESKTQNEIVICEVCQQGYHQKCHLPKIPDAVLDPSRSDDEWVCNTCKYMMGQLKAAVPGGYSSTPAVKKQKKASVDKKSKSARVKLPTKAKAKPDADPPRDLEMEISPIVPSDCSSDSQLSMAVEKLKTDGVTTVERVPRETKQVAQKLTEREPKSKPQVENNELKDSDSQKQSKRLPKTVDLVDEIAQNKALELHQEEQIVLQLRKEEQTVNAVVVNGNGVDKPTDQEPTTKAAKANPRKTVGKKAVAGKAPRKQVARPA